MNAPLELIQKPTYDASLLKAIARAADNLLSAAVQRPCKATNLLLSQVNAKAWYWGDSESMTSDTIQTLGRMPGFLESEGAQEVQAGLIEDYGTDADPDMLEKYIQEFNRLSAKHKRESSLFESSPEDFASLRCTDVANAARFEEHFGHQVKHSASHGWMAWDGMRWKRDPKEAELLAQKLGELIRGEIKGITDQMDPQDKEAFDRFEAYINALRKWVKPSESRRGITDAMKLATCKRNINADDIPFDSDPWLLNMRNGTINLRTGNLQSHKQRDHITKLAPLEYKQDAECLRWLQFLDEIFEGDQELIDYVRWGLGYSLTGNTDHHLFFILHGNGRNGKSVLLNTIADIFGPDFAQTLNPEELMVQRSARASTDLAALDGVRFLSTIETGDSRQLNEPLIKGMCGGDKIRARFMRQNSFEFQPRLKLWMATNHRPTIKDDSFAMWERVRLIPFEREFSALEKDPQLASKLRKEAPGIMAWAIEAAKEADREPPIPARVRAATECYREESDMLGDFLEECTTEWTSSALPKKDLYDVYRRWTNGRCESFRKFNDRLKDRLESTRDKNGMGWKGRAIAPTWLGNSPTQQAVV
jgi:putative DNA primase/helicase